MTGKLRLTIQPDSDGTGQLFVQASSAGFGGASSAWFDVQDLVEFAARLEVFPLPADDPPFLQGGYWENGVIDQCHVALTFRQVDLRGTIGIQVELAMPVHEDDRLESAARAAFEIQTDYASLHRFAHDLRRLATGVADDASLDAGVSAW